MSVVGIIPCSPLLPRPQPTKHNTSTSTASTKDLCAAHQLFMNLEVHKTRQRSTGSWEGSGGAWATCEVLEGENDPV